MFRMNDVQGFDPIKVAVLATTTHLNFEPSGFFEAAHDLANATIGQARFPSHPLDRRPALPIVVGVIGQSQKDEPFGLIVWASIPNRRHDFNAHFWTPPQIGAFPGGSFLLSCPWRLRTFHQPLLSSLGNQPA